MGEFLQNYGILILVAGVVVWMYSSGGSCCGHGGHGRSDTNEKGQEADEHRL